MSNASQRHTNAILLLGISVIAFGIFVFDGVSDSRNKPQAGHNGPIVTSTDTLPVEDPNAESIPLDRPEGEQGAPDISAPAE